MPRYAYIIACNAALLFGVSSAVLGATTTDLVKALTPDVAALQNGWRKDMDLNRWSAAGFHNDLKQQIETLSSAHGSRNEDIMLNLAELYITHMLLYEASSVLTGITPVGKDAIRRHRTLSDAVRLLEGKPPAEDAPEHSTSPLALPSRPDRAFWASLDAISTSDVLSLSLNIEPSFAGLSRQPAAVIRATLPVLLEAAIELDRRQYVDAALRLLDEQQDLSAATAGAFLRARAAEKRGNDTTALKGYLDAASGWDQYAVRARLAIADMSLRNGSRGALLAAQNALATGSEAWRGGRYELEVLRRLGRVYHALGNDAEHVLTLGKLLLRFPHRAETASILEEVQGLLRNVYDKGSKGQYPLSAWMALHLKLMPYFRYLDGFTDQIETFGDYVLKLGATDLAAKEFRRAARILQEKQEERDSSFNQTIFRLHLKLAQTQSRAGSYADARLTLELMDTDDAGALEEEFRIVLAGILAKLGDRPALMDAKVKVPSSDYLRNLGLAFSEEQRWTQATDVLLRLWNKYPEDFYLQDATRLLIAAYRSEDVETLDLVTRAYPSLTSSTALISLANSISEERNSIFPLRADRAAESLVRLEQAFESIAKSGISP